MSPSDCDNDRQPKLAIYTFWAPILHFWKSIVVVIIWQIFLPSWSSTKILHLALKFFSYIQICNYFRFRQPYRYFRLSVAIVRNFHLCICMVSTPNLLKFNCTRHSFREYFLLVGCKLVFLAHIDVPSTSAVPLNLLEIVTLLMCFTNFEDT